MTDTPHPGLGSQCCGSAQVPLEGARDAERAFPRTPPGPHSVSSCAARERGARVPGGLQPWVPRHPGRDDSVASCQDKPSSCGSRPSPGARQQSRVLRSRGVRGALRSSSSGAPGCAPGGRGGGRCSITGLPPSPRQGATLPPRGTLSRSSSLKEPKVGLAAPARTSGSVGSRDVILTVSRTPLLQARGG